MASVDLGTIFELEGAAAPGPALFGIWNQRSPRTHRSAERHADSMARTIWRVNWTGNLADDAAAVKHAGIGIEVSDRVLETVVPRVQAVHQEIIKGGVSAASTRTPEARLRAVLQGLGDNTDEVSFGLGTQSVPWSTLAADFGDMLENTRRMLAYPAWIESIADGTLVARTVVTWTGDNINVWRSDITPVQVRKHQWALDLSIRTRASFIRMMAIAVRVASILLRATTPLGVVAALPAAWNFASEVVREARRDRGHP